MEKSEMFCLNTTLTERGANTTDCAAVEAGTGKQAAVVTRVDDFYLSYEQAAKIMEIHERAAAEVMDALGW